MPVLWQVVRLELEWPRAGQGLPAANPIRCLQFSRWGKAPLASSLLIRSLQLLLSGEAALVTDLIKSSQFHLAREAALEGDLMRRSQFQLPREAAQAAHLIRSFRFG